MASVFGVVGWLGCLFVGSLQLHPQSLAVIMVILHDGLIIVLSAVHSKRDTRTHIEQTLQRGGRLGDLYLRFQIHCSFNSCMILHSQDDYAIGCSSRSGN